MNRNEQFNQAILKGDEVSKDDLIKLGEECGIEFPKRISKERVLIMLLENDLQDKLREYFNEFITFPIWTVADYYGINTKDIDRLEECKFFCESFKTKEFYNRSNKDYYTAKCYYESAFKYDKEKIKQQLNELKGKGYKLRIETENKEELSLITNRLKDIFELGTIDIYEKRNEGYYSYTSITLPNDTDYKKNELLVKIKNLENSKKESDDVKDERITELKKKLRETREEKVKVEKQLETYQDVSSGFEFENKKLEEKLKKTKDRHKLIIDEMNKKLADAEMNLRIEQKAYKEIVNKAKALDTVGADTIKENRELKDKLEKLEKELEEYKYKEEENKMRNKGGRPSKLSELEIESIKMYRIQGISIRELAKMFNCSIGTIHNIIKNSQGN